MKRVHTHLQHCGELCFLDTPCTSLSTECRIYFILSHSVAGGLPLGVTIVDKVNEDTLYESFELLKTVLPVSAFGGRNLLGPKVILTSRSQVEQKSLTRAFPLVTAIVCCLHLIQSTWQSVLLKDVKLDRHRARLLQLLKDIVYTDSHGEMCQKMMCLLQDPLVSMYPTFKTYVMNEVFSHHEKWMIVLGKHINLRSTYNKNIFTVSHQVLNDKIMYRCTTFTMPRLFHFFMTRLDNYYKHRLEGIISNKPDMQSYKYKPVSTFVDHDKDMKLSEDYYIITTIGTKVEKFSLDVSACICTCNMGRRGGPCQHQASVISEYNLFAFSPHLKNEMNLRECMRYIATGCEPVPESKLPGRHITGNALCNGSSEDPIFIDLEKESSLIMCESNGNNIPVEEDIEILETIENLNLSLNCSDPLQISDTEEESDYLALDNSIVSDNCLPPRIPPVLNKVLLPEDSVMEVLEQIDGSGQLPVSEDMVLDHTTGECTHECTETSCATSQVSDKPGGEIQPASECVEVLEPIDDMDLFLDMVNSMDEILEEGRNEDPEPTIYNPCQYTEQVLDDVEMEITSDSYQSSEPNCNELNSFNGIDISLEQVDDVTGATDPLETLPSCEEHLFSEIKAVNEERRMNHSKNSCRDVLRAFEIACLKIMEMAEKNKGLLFPALIIFAKFAEKIATDVQLALALYKFVGLIDGTEFRQHQSPQEEHTLQAEEQQHRLVMRLTQESKAHSHWRQETSEEAQSDRQPDLWAEQPYQQVDLIANQPHQPDIPIGQPHQPDIPIGQPHQPAISIRQPHQPAISIRQPHQPDIPIGQPHQPDIPIGQPHQPTIPMGQPHQPDIPMGQPHQPDIPMGQPHQPDIPMGQPHQPDIGAGQPQQPDIEEQPGIQEVQPHIQLQEMKIPNGVSVEVQTSYDQQGHLPRTLQEENENHGQHQLLNQLPGPWHGTQQKQKQQQQEHQEQSGNDTILPVYGSTCISVLKNKNASKEGPTINVTYECHEDPGVSHSCAFIAPLTFAVKKGFHVPGQSLSKVMANIPQAFTREEESNAEITGSAISANFIQLDINREEIGNASKTSCQVSGVQQSAGENSVVMSHSGTQVTREPQQDLVPRFRQIIPAIHKEGGIQESNVHPSVESRKANTKKSTKGNSYTKKNTKGSSHTKKNTKGTTKKSTKGNSHTKKNTRGKSYTKKGTKGKSDLLPNSMHSQEDYRIEKPGRESPEFVIGFNWDEEEQVMSRNFISFIS
ncbi:uncharacterized protein LOC122259362 [Penaeus japonicus]|uniref:uncharacterized protein LOC122259362 n=1 Tax=Penaeus japonicus TaxID=27405 RepID=UPI001C714181|nr:uncharacterized protein LOC122259362 [Penaeus japonicus]